MNRRTFLQGAAAGAATLAIPARMRSSPPGDPGLAPVLAQVEKRHDEAVKRLQQWIHQPSIAAENRGMAEGCELMIQLLKDAGFTRAERVPTDGQPGVFAILDAGAARTLALYFMYDVKQVDPAEWSSPPWDAAIVEKPGVGKVIVGRGAVNQKGPEAAFLAALHAFRGANRKLPVNLVFVADLDCISDMFFSIRGDRDVSKDLNFDNITFVLNCVDALAGDESYIDLRKRRPRQRTLTAVESLSKAHVQKEADDTKKAEDDAKKELEEATKRRDAAVEEIKKRTDVDLSTKQNMVVEVEEEEKRRFEMKEKEINDKKNSAIKKSLTDKREAVRQIRKNIKVLAVILPPIPAVLVALIIFFQRATQPKRAV